MQEQKSSVQPNVRKQVAEALDLGIAPRDSNISGQGPLPQLPSHNFDNGDSQIPVPVMQ